MVNTPTLKYIKRLPITVFIMISLFFLMTLYQCYNNVGRQVTMNARLMYSRNNTYQEIMVKGNKLHLGWEGEVYWKPKDLKEAILVNLASTDELFKFYDLFYLLVINVVLFITVKRMTEETVFSESAIKGFQIILYLLAFSPFMDFITNMCNRYFMEQLTHNELTAPMFPFAGFRMMLIASFVGAITFLFKKGILLQQEKDLTI